MTFLDGTSIRAHQKAAGAARKGALKLNGTPVKWTSLRGVEGSVRNPSTPGGRNGPQTTSETVYA